MDGASKFVHGDAIAGLLITAINLVGGLVMGIVARAWTSPSAAETFSVLSVGDALVVADPGAAHLRRGRHRRRPAARPASPSAAPSATSSSAAGAPSL